ncbi:hypothetical protein AWC31_14055 [Mycolicibacterium wolinskyi]|uniref:DUF1990 domain-containing protein n=1 Tax=Mycolicibacterium wolinskyi TaxID=59750 RepID=A0A1X2FJH3_9MYCO|nr:hypothetical protein AWC31_14055 [Mycolicibacterium wolinskyi]
MTYPEPGVTVPAADVWAATPEGFDRYDHTVAIGRGEDAWAFASGEVLQWGVKRRSGFRINPDVTVSDGVEYQISIGRWPFVVHEPVRVVAVVSRTDRCGFAYGTLRGHPVCGEEAFIVHRDRAGTVFLTLRSLTRPAPSGVWRAVFPALLVAQRFFRRRYVRSLR